MLAPQYQEVQKFTYKPTGLVKGKKRTNLMVGLIAYGAHTFKITS